MKELLKTKKGRPAAKPAAAKAGGGRAGADEAPKTAQEQFRALPLVGGQAERLPRLSSGSLAQAASCWSALHACSHPPLSTFLPSWPRLLLQAERLSKVERWALLADADLAAALSAYPSDSGELGVIGVIVSLLRASRLRGTCLACRAQSFWLLDLATRRTALPLLRCSGRGGGARGCAAGRAPAAEYSQSAGGAAWG